MVDDRPEGCPYGVAAHGGAGGFALTSVRGGTGQSGIKVVSLVSSRAVIAARSCTACTKPSTHISVIDVLPSLRSYSVPDSFGAVCGSSPCASRFRTALASRR